jgi:cell division septal protein FtsQ
MIKTKKVIYRRKQKRQSFLKKKWFWDVFLILVLCVCIFWLLLKTPFFDIKQIKIKTLPKFLSRIKEISKYEKNFFLFDKEDVTKNIKNEFAEIDKVIIQKKFPNKIIITTKQRKQIGALCSKYNNSICFLISQDGVIFKKGKSKKGLSLVIAQRNLHKGQKVVEKDLMGKIIRIDKDLRNKKIQIEKIEISIFDIVIFSKDGFRIYFSSNASIKTQETVFFTIYQKNLSKRDKKNLEYIDLRRLQDGEKGAVYWK